MRRMWVPSDTVRRSSSPSELMEWKSVTLIVGHCHYSRTGTDITDIIRRAHDNGVRSTISVVSVTRCDQ